MKRRIISILLVLVLIISLAPSASLLALSNEINYFPLRKASNLNYFDNQKSSSLIDLQDKDLSKGYLLASLKTPITLSSMNSLAQISPDSMDYILASLCLGKKLKLDNKQDLLALEGDESSESENILDRKIELTSDLVSEINSLELITVSKKQDVFSFNEGDALSLGLLLNLYFVSESKVFKDYLVEYLFTDYDAFNDEIDFTLKKLKTLNTLPKKHTTLYDMFILINELFKFDMFINAIGSEYIDFMFLSADNEEISLRINNPSKASDFSKSIPSNYKYAGNIGNEIVFLSDKEDRYFVAITNDCELKEATDLLISKEVVGLIKENTIPAKAQLPIESNQARYEYIFGEGTNVTYYTMENRPKAYSSSQVAKKNMKTFTVPVWKINAKGNKYASTYSITVNKLLAESVKAIFNEIYKLEIKFPVKYMIGYAYRKVGGVGLMSSRLMSVHTFGAAIDINPGDYDNDYYLGFGNDLRDKDNPYYIPQEVIDIFAKYGWFWGGNFKICADTMHFQYLGLDFLDYEETDEFPKLEYSENKQKDKYVTNLQERLVKLGYLDKANVVGFFDLETDKALKAFQEDYELDATGVTDYKTWETIINLTHYMRYEF